MQWITDNWGWISIILIVGTNALAMTKWAKYAKFARVLISGVQDYVESSGNARVKKLIKERAIEEGVEAKLNPVVKRVKRGWVSPLKKVG